MENKTIDQETLYYLKKTGQIWPYKKDLDSGDHGKAKVNNKFTREELKSLICYFNKGVSESIPDPQEMTVVASIREKINGYTQNMHDLPHHT